MFIGIDFENIVMWHISTIIEAIYILGVKKQMNLTIFLFVLMLKTFQVNIYKGSRLYIDYKL